MESIIDIEELQNTVTPLMVDYGMNLIGAILMLVAGWIAAGWLSNRVAKFTAKSSRIDHTIGPILVKGTKILVLIVTLLAVLQQFGVETASILAVLGTIGLAIGLALQGTLSNIASGFMLLLLRPFNVGDTVDIGGTMGIVDEIGLFVTEMHSFDNIAITMPNSQIWGTKIENYTANETRRADMVFGIGYADSIDKAMQIIKEELDADERVLKEPEMVIAVNELADSSVNIVARPWTQTPDVWPLRFDVTKKIKERFDQEGISIPFPQRDVHVFQNNGNE